MSIRRNRNPQKENPFSRVRPGGPRTRLDVWLNRPMTSFHLVVSTSALLVTLGLIMVLSASGVRSYDDGGSVWTIFGRQVLWTHYWLGCLLHRVENSGAGTSAGRGHTLRSHPGHAGSRPSTGDRN